MIVPGRLRALIIDDNGYARSAVAATLRKLGLGAIEEFSSAAPAIGAIAANRCDIVFLDWYMPEMNGAAVLEVIRDPRFSPNGQVPVVMMTAYPNRETIARAKALGAGEVLVKPFTAAATAAALGRLLPDGWAVPENEAAPVAKGQVFL